ncbi:MAG: aminotransferase class III-fold pyridoxal phosphate-dependent enzyme [Pseudomonadota bacterium]
MSLFDTPPPDLTQDQLATILRETYGLDGKIQSLVSERDQNASITLPSGERFVLKIANAAEDPQQLDYQNKALRHIAERDPGLGVPRVVASQSGADLAKTSIKGQVFQVRLLSFLEGRLVSDRAPSLDLLSDLGRFLGRLDLALRDFMHPAALRPDFLWNLDQAGHCRKKISEVTEGEARSLVEAVFERHETVVRPRLNGLRHGVIHQDGNDNNLLVHDRDTDRIAGIIDFGDMVWGCQINELAVSMAYMLMQAADPVAAARSMVEGYNQVLPLEPEEVRVVMDLVALRLAASVVVSSWRGKNHPDNDYLMVSQAPALELLRTFSRLNGEEVHLVLRAACGWEPVAQAPIIEGWLTANRAQFKSILPGDLRRAKQVYLPMTEKAPGVEHAANPEAYGAFLDRFLKEADADIALGGYLEDRVVYRGEQFKPIRGAEYRTIHLGIDLFGPAGTKVRTPLDGVVASATVNGEPYDYGGTLILQHQAGPEGPIFWTLYGHLSHASAQRWKAGQTVAAGATIAEFGSPEENGGWAPHVHFQVMSDLLGDHSGNFPGVAAKSRLDVWRRVCLDPNLILGLAPESLAPSGVEPEHLKEQRLAHLGPSLSLSYRDPLTIVRGEGCWLLDQHGRAYLDCVNNICHVGHSHPRVVAALADQAGRLNTNTRYLHPEISRYAQRIAATMPGDLKVCFFVCSGSEANELALRLARTYTGRRGVVVLDHAYHGNTSNLVDISPYKCEGPGGAGLPGWVAKAPFPDPYRGAHRGMTEETGSAYAQGVASAVTGLNEREWPPAFFIAESIAGVGGQVVLPPGFLREAYAHVRAAGGLCIADEVQVGFGRVGSHMWAFETQGVVPDIVSLGKPMGNGHPLACVVTTPDIAAAFHNGMEYFNSFGGNPVSCAVGNAVLDIIEEEGLRQNAEQTGRYLRDRLLSLAERYEVIGDVRGLGLFVGLELVLNRQTQEPATAMAGDLVNAAREVGVLLSTDGPHNNVLKMKPPICFGHDHADLLCDTLDVLLAARN